MSMISVPSLDAGERSLPAELRTSRGVNFAQRRLSMNLVPSAQGMRGMRGLGDDSFTPEEDPIWVTDNPGTGDTAGMLPPANVFPTPTDPGSTISFFKDFNIDPNTASTAAPYVKAPAGYTGPTVVAASASTPAAPNGYQWASLINASGNNLAKILTLSQGGSAVTLANGSQLLYGSPQAAASAGNVLGALTSATGLSSTTVMLVGGAVLLFVLMGNKR